MLTLLLTLFAHADEADAPEPVGCNIASLEAPSSTVSVAWISPLGKRVSGRKWMPVVPTSELKRALQATGGHTGRLLQLLGERKRPTEPRRPWKVTIFQVDAKALCRPLAGYEEFAPVAGTVTCPATYNKADGNYDGCGRTTDLATGLAGVQQYRVQWRDAAREGFCVLSTERFLAESRR